MGSLRHFNLKPFIQKYDINYMIETGTFQGDAVAYALEFNFKNIYTIELIKEYYEYCCKRFEGNKNVVLLNNNSKDGLLEIFKKYDVGNCIYWLDAHLPNLYNKSYSGNYLNEKEILIPLEEELKIIVSNKNISNDVFIIDDLRIYENGNFQAGNWSDAINAGVGGINFIYEILGKTHTIEKLYDDHGYILCIPKI